jgi:hypothetical protein
MAEPSMAKPGPSLLGTWKVASVQTSGVTAAPFPQPAKYIFSARDGGIHYVAESLFRTGEMRAVESTFRIDGQWYPIQGGRWGDKLSVEQTSSHTFEVIVMRESQTTFRAAVALSEDGRIMSASWEIVPAEGPTVTGSGTAEREL